jgi:MraZ protein
MFFGRFEHTIDDKGRLTVPSRHRAELAGGLVITRGLDPCLFIYPLARWQEISEKFEQLPAVSQEDVGEFMRFVFAEAMDAVPDKQGRISIPDYLRTYAQLGDQVIVAGVRDHLEVWRPDLYAKVNSRMEQDPKSLARGLRQFGIL